MKENFELIDKLVELNWYSLFLISILIIPSIISGWIGLVKSLEIELSIRQKKIVMITFMSIYCIGVCLAKIGHDYVEGEKWRDIAEKCETQILNENAKFRVLSFGRIRLVYPEYSDITLYKVVEKFPDRFAIVSIADAKDSSKRDANDPVGFLLKKLK